MTGLSPFSPRSHGRTSRPWHPAIENHRDPKCNMYEARRVVEMIAAAFESQRIGGPVTFPLETRVNPLTPF
ncbi:MAG: hypothetical protein AB7U20_16285 [Planctomycetaceae bacterium]